MQRDGRDWREREYVSGGAQEAAPASCSAVFLFLTIGFAQNASSVACWRTPLAHLSPFLELPHRKQASHTSKPAMDSEVAVVEQAASVLMQQVLSHQTSGIRRRGPDTHSTAAWLHQPPLPRQNLTCKGFSTTPLKLFNAPGALAANSSSLQSKPTALLGVHFLIHLDLDWAWFSRELGSRGALGLQLHSSSGSC